MKKVVDQQQKNLNTNSKSFFNQNDQIWENQTQSNYKNNIYYQEFLNTSKNVSSNDNLLNSIKKTHLQSLDNDYLLTNNFVNQNTNSNNHLSHTQSFYLSNNTESSEKSNSNSNINYHHSSFNYQFTSNTPHLIYQEKQDPRYQICLDKVSLLFYYIIIRFQMTKGPLS